MPAARNKAVMRRVFEEAINKENISIISNIISPEYVGHNPLGDLKGMEGFKQLVVNVRTTFPDYTVSIEDMVAEGEKVAAVINIQGTFKGEFMGMAPTGKQLNIREAVFMRFAGGKVVEDTRFTDTLTFCQQLGVKPPGM
jgi:steroid delta-isomerase-like uncharacterized protein